MTDPRPFRLEEATIDELHAAIRAGETSCIAVVRQYIERARAYNGVASLLVTEAGGQIPEASGAVRAGAPLALPLPSRATQPARRSARPSPKPSAIGVARRIRYAVRKWATARADGPACIAPNIHMSAVAPIATTTKPAMTRARFAVRCAMYSVIAMPASAAPISTMNAMWETAWRYHSTIQTDHTEPPVFRDPAEQR